MQTLQQPTDWPYLERAARRRFRMARAVSSPGHQPRHLDACDCDVDPGICDMHKARAHIARRMQARTFARAHGYLFANTARPFLPVISRRAS